MDFTDFIKQKAKSCGVDIDNKKYSDEEIKRFELQEDLTRIENYILKKFGEQFSEAKKISQFNFSSVVSEKIKSFMTDNKKKFLVLKGGTGTAKTCLAKIIFQRWIEKRFEKCNSYVQAINNSDYIRAVDFFDELKKCFGDADSVSEFIKYHQNLNLLIIDEVGATYGSQNEVIQFTRLIDDFYRTSNHKMILITNIMQDEELEKYIGKPGFSRICEVGDIISFNGVDYRKQFKKEVAA